MCFAGDGCFMMYPQELATAMQFDAPVIVIVVNNGMLATIRMHQEREYPGRVSGTRLANPDFVALARAFGAHAERVDETEAFPAAFDARRGGGQARADRAAHGSLADHAPGPPQGELTLPSLRNFPRHRPGDIGERCVEQRVGPGAGTHQVCDTPLDDAARLEETGQLARVLPSTSRDAAPDLGIRQRVARSGDRPCTRSR